MKNKTLHHFSREISNAFDKASKIALAFYIFPLTYMAFLQVFYSQTIISYVFIPLGIFLFLLHFKITKDKYDINLSDIFNDKNTFYSIQRIVYYLVMSMAFSVYLTALIDPNLNSVVVELAEDLMISGSIMFHFLATSLMIIFTNLFLKLLDFFGVVKLQMVFAILFLIICMRFFYYSGNVELFYKIGLILLGPVNLLMANILFSRVGNNKII